MSYRYEYTSEEQKELNRIKNVIKQAGELLATAKLCLISCDEMWQAEHAFYDFKYNRTILVYDKTNIPGNNVIVFDEDEDLVILSETEKHMYHRRVGYAIDTLKAICVTKSLSYARK